MDGTDYFHEACNRDPKPYRRGRNGKYQCPCCGYFTLNGYNCYDICPVCWWEDDGAVEDEHWGGPNNMTLGEGRENYGLYKDSDGPTSSRIGGRANLRDPLPDEIE